MSIVTCQSVSRDFFQGNHTIHALQNIHLTVPAGQFLTIMGPSGSGKSTLMHLLGGVDRPTEGEIIIDGTPLTTMSERDLAVFRRRKVGIIYQFFNLIPTLNVRQNILLPLLLDRRKVDQAQYESLLTRLSIQDISEALPGELSGGQAQRVAIARALINDPAIILADEPTGNLDRRNTEAIMALLRTANQLLDQTIILITHNETIALETDRLVMIEDGRIMRDEVLRR